MPRLASLAAVAAVSFLPLSPVLAHTPPNGEQLGKVEFPVSCAAQSDFNRGVALLHSFWFLPANKAFRDIAAKDPSCGMAWWGVAMVTLGNPLAGAPSPQALKVGLDAADKAKAAGAKTERERDYIAAIDAFYRDHDKIPHRQRALAYEQAMERLMQKYPQDIEAKIFYALALNVTLDPSDKTYANQLKAAAVLEKAFDAQPEHPGVAHYLIHSYDFPPIAKKGLNAAQRYAKIAPDSPHALHMPSHIFTRVGYWKESIESNRASAAAAMKEYAAQPTGAALSNAYHGYDYMAYAHLQLAQDKAAKALAEEIVKIKKIDFTHTIGAVAAPYALAAIPVRYALERDRWAEAAQLEVPVVELPWQDFPQTSAIVAFGRGLGAARNKDVATAEAALAQLRIQREALKSMKQGYWENQVAIQIAIVEAWMLNAQGKTDAALDAMRKAAEAEDKTEKHPVTPGPIIPARELLGDMLMLANKPADALAAYEHSMQVEPNRFRGLAGAARAAEAAGDRAKAKQYYERLLDLANDGDGDRPVVKQARDFIAAK